MTALEIKSGHKPMFIAGMASAAALAVPILDCAEQCLRGAGVGPRPTRRLINAWLEAAVRTHHRAGRKGWRCPLASYPALLDRLAPLLEDMDPVLGRVLAASIASAKDWSGI